MTQVINRLTMDSIAKIMPSLIFHKCLQKLIKQLGGFRCHSFRRKEVKQNPGKVDNLSICLVLQWSKCEVLTGNSEICKFSMFKGKLREKWKNGTKSNRRFFIWFRIQYYNYISSAKAVWGILCSRFLGIWMKKRLSKDLTIQRYFVEPIFFESTWHENTHWICKFALLS